MNRRQKASPMETLLKVSRTSVTVMNRQKAQKQLHTKSLTDFVHFCENYWAKLFHHIVNKRKDVERVKVALTLPEQQKDEAFDMFKKEGIWKINQDQSSMKHGQT